MTVVTRQIKGSLAIALKMQRKGKQIAISGYKVKEEHNLRNGPLSEKMTKIVRKYFKDEISLRRVDCKNMKFKES